MVEDFRIYIAVIGVGGVGQHFLSQLFHLTNTYPQISLLLLSRSTKTVLGSPDYPISLSTWESDLAACTAPPLSVDDILAFLSNLQSDKVVLVDNTSDQIIANAYLAFLDAGINIVTPNKKAFSGSLDLWRAIFPPSTKTKSKDRPRGLCYHESTVGAGLPILSTLHDLLATGDTIHRIEGVFSGTLSFLFNSFAPLDGNGGGKWSDEVNKAKELGYTEPDPRDDLNGLDVARKLTILARLASLPLPSPTSIPTESLIPPELSSPSTPLSASAFLEKLPAFDDRMEIMKQEAMAEGKVLRYVGKVDVQKGEAKVGLEKVEKGGPVAGLRGSDNLVCFWTERYGGRPLVVQGAGAGGAVTAMGVTADLIKVIQRIS